MKNYFEDFPESAKDLTDYQRGFVRGIYRSIYEIERSVDTTAFLSAKIKNVLNTLIKKGGDKGVQKKKATESLALRLIKAVLNDGIRSVIASYTETVCEIFSQTPDELEDVISPRYEIDNLMFYDKTNDIQRGIIAGHGLVMNCFINIVNMGDKIKEQYGPMYNMVLDDLNELFKDCPPYLSENTVSKYAEWEDDIADCVSYIGISFAQNIYVDVLSRLCSKSVDELNEYYKKDENIENWDVHDKDGNRLNIKG